MQTPTELAARYQQEMAEQAAAGERARKQNVEVFARMWLTLGSDVLKLDGNRHDAALAEARGLAVFRWNQLINMEQQVIREEQKLATRPKTRPVQRADDQLPDRTIEKQDREWQAKTEYLRTTLEELKEQAKRERKELESYITRR